MKTILSNSTIVLKIHVVHAGATKSIPLDMNAPIYAVCEHIRSIIREAEPESGKESKDYGLFLPHEMSKNGLWLDNMKNLVQYILKPGDILEYRYRFRWLTIKTQDDIKKTLLVDDSWTVSELMILLCAKMGILNHEEYSLIQNNRVSDQTRPVTTTKVFCIEKEQDKLEKLKKKLQTDDDLNWLNPSQTLRQQGIDEQEVLLVQRKYFFSDMNIDTRDPIQLSLLFIQSKEAILNGKHPVSMLEAEQLAALQCQADLGDTNTQKGKLTKISLKECVPKDYLKNKGIEKRIVKLYSNHNGKDSIEAKREYCALCRSLKTYGITFFLVKEKIKGKSKLIPRLLGVSRDRVLRLDEKTKEILKTWPLTSIRRWAGSFNAFTMDFGEYAPNEYYTAQTNKGEQISQLISGYVDIIIKHQKAQEPHTSDGFEESSVAETKIEPNQAEIVEHRSSFQGKSIEDISREIQMSMKNTPTDELSRPISATDSSPFDVTCVTSILHSADDQTIKSDPDDFDNVKISKKTVTNLEIDPDDLNQEFGLKQTIPRYSENRELESAMSFGTSRSVQNYYSNSQNRLHSPEPIRVRNPSPDSFMTGGTRICHTVRRLNLTQQSLLRNINVNLQKIHMSKQLLDEKINQRNFENINKEEQRKNIKVISKEHAIYNLGSMNTEVVQVLRSSKHAPLNAIATEKTHENNENQLKEIEKSFKIITVHFPSFVDNVRIISEMNSSTIDDITEIKTTDTEEEIPDDTPETLIDAARKLADAFSGMLNAVKPQEEERDIDFRKAILDAANKVGEASSQLFRQITSSDRSVMVSPDNCSRLGRLLQNSDHDYEDSLIFLVRSVANATANLVQAVKTVTQNESQSDVIIGCQKLIGPVTHAGLATSQLVTCVKILAPTINQANCTNQILAEIDEVRATIDNVSSVTNLILNNCRTEMSNSPVSILNDVEETVMNVRLALENLEDHLRCGITIVNFAPRIQSLELFLIEYDKLKSLLVKTSSTFKKSNVHDELAESLKNLLVISGKINEEIVFLCDPEQGPDDPILKSQRMFSSILVRILELNKNLSEENPEKWKEIHYEIDNLVTSLLYESGTRFISHDQLIHNLYRSAQILITCCHKLITSYHQVMTSDRIVPECSEVINRSEFILLIMNNLKFDPTNEKILASFIRESEKLAQSCVLFCRTIHNTIPNTSDDIMIDIMAVAASQTLAECEHMAETIRYVKPIRPHLELAAVSKMLQENKLNNLQKSFSSTITPKQNLSQLFQISIAILEKMKSNIQQTLPRAHFSSMFEMYNMENAEPSLSINLYHHLVKMSEIIEADNQVDLSLKFKNATLLMYRLCLIADSILISYGQHSGNDYPVLKCVDELLSTMTSLQSKSGNIFDRFKSNILNKQNIFRSKMSTDVENTSVESSQSYDFQLEKANMSIKMLIENSIMCSQNISSPKLMDNLCQLYQAFDDIAGCSETIITLTRDTKIIDDFIILSLSLLNFVLEIDNSMSVPEDQLLANRISNKYRLVTESATRLQQTLSQTFKTYRGAFNDSICNLQETRKILENKSLNHPSVWDRKAFVRLLDEQMIIKASSDELKEMIETNQLRSFEGQIFGITDAVCEICVTVFARFSPFDEKHQLISRSIDLSLNIINASINILKTTDRTSNTKKIGFMLKDLTDNISYLINCVREQIPGYKECSSALAIIAQISHDINEIEFSIASENENVNYTMKFEEENKKKSATLLSDLAKSVFNIELSLENEIIPDEKLSQHIEEFTNILTELMNLIIRFAKTESLTSEVKSYIGHANELIDSADRYLQDVKQFFENICIKSFVHSDGMMKDLVNQIVVFLRVFDNAMAESILAALESRTRRIKLPESDINFDMANTMSGMITDDDTTILFASAGIKNCDVENFQNSLAGQFLLNGEQKSVVSFKKDGPPNMSIGFRNLIHKTAEALVLDTQSLVQNSGDKQRSLATNTESVILTISNLANDCENGFVEEPRKRSEVKMMDAIRNVRSSLNNVYSDGGSEISRLIVSNSPSLIKQENYSGKLALSDTNCLDDTIQKIQSRVDRFTENINNHTNRSLQRTSNVKLDGIIEILVNHASSVLALSSELMRMPLQKLFQSPEQCKTVSVNISSQCRATLFDYLDSLEELTYNITSTKVIQKITNLGTSLSNQFIKLFMILKNIQKDPDNKFIKSSMLDVFYEIQNGIKVLVEFSEEVQKTSDCHAPSPRKVSFRDKSPVDFYQNAQPQDPLLLTKETINQLNKILSDLSFTHQNLVSSEDSVQLKLFINLITRFAKVSTDLIGLSNHCRGNDDPNEKQSNESHSINKEISDCFDDITNTIKNCVYGKYRNLGDQLDHVKTIVTLIASKSADLLNVYRRQEIKSSWHQLLQTVATDLRNISKEILQFDSNNHTSSRIQDQGSSKQLFAYVSTSTKSPKLTNE